MAKVKVGIKGFTREQIADKLNTVKTSMTGNANFTTPNPPTQAQVQAIQNKLNELINAITRPAA